MPVAVIRGAQRHHWSNEWLHSAQSFPVTGNFDLQANAFGVLMVHNEDVVDVGSGFDTHQHRDSEIVTWLLAGSIEHRDSSGHSGVIVPGLVQRMTAGRGITHSERNASTRAEGLAAHVVQMWLPPDTDGLDPSYAERDFTADLADGALVPVVSGLRRHADTPAVSIANRYVALHVARLPSGVRVDLPPAQFGHLFVARGEVEVDGVGVLAAGDVTRHTDMAADGPAAVTAVSDVEILYWEMHASFDL
ncbi:pirin family protein [Williamsia maris]|uniref:Pirin N-terminal domain-containing protein n=1 Tax=Williamsia maris TaxID=72806 RepID=A0ABT1HGM7_9NOCA|nr:pirin family protein [Williamsia maris]MCP2176145.1 hypothetical protein [Williamsia maris]